MASKIQHVKFKDAVRVPGGTELSISFKKFDIELDGSIVKVWPKGQAHKCQPVETTLMNVIDFQRLPEEVESDVSAPTVASRKAKAGK